ncbi:unnamed protein product [Dibothriocephalus latus]|uniref:Ig-like domain-containing protein n=1 Tax=Dibothriocephalus latus TaxID=60516 RepID=A0A3P6VD25_DIBLA|nr:unnamed protein product [Dibothriocephalus latus]
MVRADSVTDELPPEGQRRDEVAVVILPPPPTVFIPRNASVEPGGMVRLTCSVFTQASEVEINWYRGHDVRFKVKDGRRHQIRTAPGEATPAGRTFTSTLTIAEAQDIDVGKYICEAEHKGGVSSADGFVIIHATDAGRYSCHAANSAGEEIAIMNAKFVARPEIVRVESQREMPQEGESQVLRCLATGQPPPTIKWEFNGSPVSQSANIRVNETTGELMIMQVKRTMTGKWTCVAENVAGTTRSSISLDVGYKPKMDVGSMHDRVLGEFAADLLIPCYVEGQPVPQIKWYKMVGSTQVPVSYGDRYTLDPDNSLHIRNVDMEDGTTFICEASNTYGRDQHHVTVELGGIKAPTISFTDPRQVILEGSAEKVLTCYVLDAKPPATVTWLKDSQEIDLSSPRYSVVDNNLIIRDIKGSGSSVDSSVVISNDGQTLTVYAVTEETSGVFTCSAINPHAVESKDFQVVVKTPPFIEKEGFGDIEIAQNEATVLTCLVSQGFPQPEVRWFKNGQPVVPVPGRITMMGGGNSLEIRGESEEDTGSYECRAENEAGSDSRFYQVTVLVPPTFTSTHAQRRLLVRTGDRVDISCGMTGYPEPTISWTWNGRPLEGKLTDLGIATRLSSDRMTSYLTINNMQEDLQGNKHASHTSIIGLFVPHYLTGDDSPETLDMFTGDPDVTPVCDIHGPLIQRADLIRSASDASKMPQEVAVWVEFISGYTCVGQNRGGQTSSDYEVILLREPKIVDFSERAVVFLNNTITLTCGAEGNPKPKITWLFMGQRLSPDETPGYR